MLLSPTRRITWTCVNDWRRSEMDPIMNIGLSEVITLEGLSKCPYRVYAPNPMQVCIAFDAFMIIIGLHVRVLFRINYVYK